MEEQRPSHPAWCSKIDSGQPGTFSPTWGRLRGLTAGAQSSQGLKTLPICKMAPNLDGTAGLSLLVPEYRPLNEGDRVTHGHGKKVIAGKMKPLVLDQVVGLVNGEGAKRKAATGALCSIY